MTTDLLKFFRSCFLCKKHKNLLRVVHPGYHLTFHYYHEECLTKVLKDPEKHTKYLDMAIQITDQIESDRHTQQVKNRRLQESIQRVKEISNTIFDVADNVLENKLHHSTEEINKLLDKINEELQKTPDIKNETTKFEKIFKNGQ